MKRGLFALLAALSLFAASIASAQDSYTQQQQQSTTDAQSQTQDPAPVDQATTTDASTTTSSLPATASPVPLLGFVGLLTLAAGVWVIRARRRA